MCSYRGLRLVGKMLNREEISKVPVTVYFKNYGKDISKDSYVEISTWNLCLYNIISLPN